MGPSAAASLAAPPIESALPSSIPLSETLPVAALSFDPASSGRPASVVRDEHIICEPGRTQYPVWQENEVGHGKEEVHVIVQS
jgi:hypothetical protein